MNMKKYLRAGLLTILLLATALMGTACGNEAVLEGTQPDGENVQTQQDLADIKTRYLTLTYPETYAQVLLHQEVTADDVTMEVFSMKAGDGTMELFRICFGDGTIGNFSGYLVVDGQEIPVTYVISQYNDEEFANEETKAQYYETMNCMNDIMGALHADDRFCLEKAEQPVEETETVLTYWTLTLPETMECEESESNGQYQAAFYGNVAGDRIALYTIYLGKPAAETVLGTFDVDGTADTLSIESYEIELDQNWTDEEREAAYGMLATVNDVLQAIMSDEGFSELIPQ